MTVLILSQELLWDFLSRDAVSMSTLEKSGFGASFWTPPSSSVAG